MYWLSYNGIVSGCALKGHECETNLKEICRNSLQDGLWPEVSMMICE